jgi:protease PrsW
VAVHTLFNQFPEQPVLTMVCTVVAAPLVLLAIFRFGSAEASDWLKTEQAMHREHLQILRQGRFPDDANNRRVAALAARCDPQNRERIREYLEVHTALVLCAEETLMDQSISAEQVWSGDAAALFDRLETLRRGLGRSLYAELQPLLPFSRNDLWEVSELRERLGRANG